MPVDDPLNAFIKLLIPAKTFLKILPMIGKFVFVYSIKRVIEFSPAALLAQLEND
ncbi:Uncharacterised protein [Staphylococcus aureus]|nr:Uncharacterised protein [Staphylococcus aureus]SAN41784.1 Uncharacterised protein [Staphylococcus aureus]SAN44236.1 Uncharacterised protein [Staphylococcus aureus]